MKGRSVAASMRIVESTDRRALARLLKPGVRADRTFDRRVRAIVDAVRRDGDRALERFARRFDDVTGALEVDADEMQREAARVPVDVRRAIARAARAIARVAFRQIPAHFDVEVTPG